MQVPFSSARLDAVARLQWLLGAAMIRQAKCSEGDGAVEGIFPPVFETLMTTLSPTERDACVSTSL